LKITSSLFPSLLLWLRQCLPLTMLS